MKYFDIHTHLLQSEDDVKGVLNIQTDDPIPKTEYSLGLHPWFVREENLDRHIEIIEKQTEDEKCIVIGECGLDRPTFRKSGNGDAQHGLKLQSEAFLRQIEIANLAEKPLVIHCVRAFYELLEIRKTASPATSWIIHGFRGSQEIAESFIKEGIYLSFGKSLLSESPGDLKIKQIFKTVPDNLLLLETDNVETLSRDIKEVYCSAAELRNTSIHKLQDIIKMNIERILG